MLLSDDEIEALALVLANVRRDQYSLPRFSRLKDAACGDAVTFGDVETSSLNQARAAMEFLRGQIEGRQVATIRLALYWLRGKDQCGAEFAIKTASDVLRNALHAADSKKDG